MTSSGDTKQDEKSVTKRATTELTQRALESDRVNDTVKTSFSGVLIKAIAVIVIGVVGVFGGVNLLVLGVLTGSTGTTLIGGILVAGVIVTGGYGFFQYGDQIKRFIGFIQN